MRHRLPKLGALAASCVMVVALLHLPLRSTAADQEATSERFSMTVINMTGVGPGGMTTMDVTVSRWSTAEQRTELINALTEQGPDALITALRGQEETGFIRGRNMRAGSDRLKYAWQSEVDGKRRIVLASDQETIFEASAGPRGAGHKFTLIELMLEADGTGEGMMWAFAALKYDPEKNQIVVESYGTEPLRLGNVRTRQ